MKVLTETIKQQVGTKNAAVPVFGDAESLAAAAVILKALPCDKVYFIHIDHGLLRLSESEYIFKALKALGAEHIIRINAETEFLTATANADGKIIGPLSNTFDPICKRKLMSVTLKKVFDRAAMEIGDAVKIGIHDMCDFVFSLDKEAVRELTEGKGINSMLLRQPFPTPALAVRILCNESVIALTTEQRQRLADAVSAFGNEYSSRLLPIRTVGIVDGVRSYKSMAMLCAKGCDSDFETVAEISKKVHRTLPFISRTLLRVDSDEPSVPCHDRALCINRESARVLRLADEIVATGFESTPAVQFFAVLVPVVVDKSKDFSVIIRAVLTEDFKTAAAAVPGKDFPKEVLASVTSRIKERLGNCVDMVLYDMTSKPPAAIEFE